jgi:all-trans-retinol dehydrogenase (NAD+)
MSQIKDKVVLVTGGANGIGKLLGEKCLQEGARHLVIWDINPANLDKTVARFQSQGYQVSGYLVDVADVKDIEDTAQRVLAEVGKVDILFNNAGIVVGKLFKDHTTRDIEKTFDINVLGVMHVTRNFLPAMLQYGSGHIVNIASASSLTPNPKMSVYASSKWAVMGWSESIRIELERENRELRVTTVCPGYIDTGMFAGTKAPLLTPILKPEYITDLIIRAVKKNKLFVMAPATVHLLPPLRGILPTRWFDFIGGKVFGIYKTMADFVGRPPQEAVPEKPTETVK